MNLKKLILCLSAIVLLFAAGCSKQVYFDGENESQLNYSFAVSDPLNIDNTLSNQKYLYSTDIDKKYAALITYKFRIASINQYLIDKDGTIDLTIPKDSQFIISLPANRTITYTWNIKNSINNGILQLDKRSWIEIPLPISSISKPGEGYDRQNFYFSSLKSGNEKVVMRYEHQTQQSNEYFEITFNIKME